MATGDVIQVSLLTPEGVAFRGPAHTVVAPSAHGLMGILPGHAPLISSLTAGIVKVEGPASTLFFVLDGGFMEVRRDRQVIILAERVESAHNHDDARGILNQRRVAALKGDVPSARHVPKED